MRSAPARAGREVDLSRAGLVLVTGATGFVGRDLLARLLARGYRVRAAARDPSGIPERPGLEVAALPDLALAVDLSALVAGVSDVVHLAGIAHATASIPEARYRDVNADASVALARASRAAGVRSFVLMSSVRAQSGPTASRPLRDADPPQPTDAYGRSKLAAGQSVYAALSGSGVRAVALRPVLVHGPGVKGNLRALLRLARLPLPLPLAGLGNKRSLVGLANLGAAIGHAIECEEVAGSYLVSDGPPVTVGEIIASLRAGLERGPGLFRAPLTPLALALRIAGRSDVWERLAGDLVVDTSRLSATGWRPVATTAEGLAAMARASI